MAVAGPGYDRGLLPFWDDGQRSRPVSAPLLLTSDAPLLSLLDGRRQDGPFDWTAVRMYDFEYDGTVEKHKSLRTARHRGRRGQNGEGRDVQAQAQAQAQQIMGIAGADHDG